jgi:hypothetical protein
VSPTPPRTALALLALLAPLAACSGAQTGAHAPRERQAREFLPLHQSAAWSFDAVDMDRGGISTLVVMRVVRDDGTGGYYVQTGNSSTPPAIFEYVQGGITRNGELVLTEPIRAGERWRGTSGDGYAIRGVGESRTVPGGTFRDVIEVVRTAGDARLTDGTEYRETYWYAPGVGPIEAVIPLAVAPGDVRRYHLTLRGYTLDGQY